MEEEEEGKKEEKENSLCAHKCKFIFKTLNCGARVSFIEQQVPGPRQRSVVRVAGYEKGFM